MWRNSKLIISSLVAIAAALATTAHAEELLGDPIAGQKLAQDVCRTCHVVAPDQEPKATIETPAFPDLAKQPGVTAISLRVFLQTPHDRMPDIHLSREETDNIIAYILSLAD